MIPQKPSPTSTEQLVALLQQLVAQGGIAPGALDGADALRPWQASFLQPPALDGRLSATDRLSWWFQPASPAARSTDPWGAFFDTPAAPLPLPAVATPALPPPGPPPAEPSGWTGLRLLLAEPEEALAEAEAEAVVDCLYDFIHAVGRRDVERALHFVADDFHTLEEDREIDKLGLRHQLERLLDSLRDWDFTIALVELPYPVLHPDGILVYAQIQIDAVAKEGEKRQTILYPRLAVFHQQGDGTWRIDALTPLELGD